MFALLLVIMAALVFISAGLVGLVGDKRTVSQTGMGATAGIALLLAIGIFIAGSIALIPNGNVGVMTRFGKVTGTILDAGFNWKSIIETPVTMSVQTQLFTDDATAASKDLQDVTATIAINYKLNRTEAPTVYRTIGHDYIAVVGHPIVQETVKEVTARYNAEDMILKRADVKEDMADEIAAKLAERGVIAESINITNFSFSEVFGAAIEAKVVAVQKVLEAENKLRQIEVEARQAEQKAKGEAAANIALATGQAEANRILGESLTPTLIQYMFIQSIKSTDKVVTVPGNISLTLPQP